MNSDMEQALRLIPYEKEPRVQQKQQEDKGIPLQVPVNLAPRTLSGR